MGTAANGTVEHGQNNNDSNSASQRLQPSACAQLVALVQDRSTPEGLGAWLKVPLEHAVYAGDKELTTQLILAGASGDPMMGAIIGGHQDLVQHLLLVHGGKILERGGGHTHIAASLGQAPVVSLLLDHGADIYQRTSTEGHESALDFAAMSGHAEVISVIAQRGGSEIVNAAFDNTGYTALHRAAERDQERSIDALVEGGAQLELEDDEGYAALHIAAKYNSAAAIRALIRHGADIESTTLDGLSPVMLAIEEGHQGAVTILMDAGADVNSRDGGRSVVEHAVWAVGTVDPVASSEEDREDSMAEDDALGSRIDLVRTLLEHGARAGDASHGNRTALHAAAWFDLVPVIDILIEAGADIEVKDEGAQKTPLFVACCTAGNVGAINALVRHGANIHAREAPSGNTPLHAAARNCLHERSSETVDALLKGGADETMLNAAGLMPVHLVEDVDDGDESDPEIERIRSLLVNAPRDRADRVWGRRALFVLCRAFPERIRLVSPDNGEDERSQSPAAADATADDSATVPAKRKNEAKPAGHTVEGTLSSGSGGAAYEFKTAMGRLIRLREDCIFREIMGFL